MNYSVDMKKTGAHIKELCEKNNITVADIKRELNLKSPQSVYRWYYGYAIPTVDHLYTLACMLHVPVDELIVLYAETLSDERVMEIFIWCTDKLKPYHDLRISYWEVLGVLILE